MENELQDYLNNLKKSPCLRLNYEETAAHKKRMLETFCEAFPDLLCELDPLNFDLPIGWYIPFGYACKALNGHKIKVTQVKQKFGDLRIYFSVDEELGYTAARIVNNECQNIVAKTAKDAASTCEFCSCTEKVTLWEIGYVARVCVYCKQKLAEYHILSWMLESNRDFEEVGLQQALRYSKRVLNEIRYGLEPNDKSFTETVMKRLDEAK